MQKVIVIGCPGSGKSTFARHLSRRTGLPIFYLDRIWHKADKTTVSREEFDARLDEILKLDAWIIDGNYNRTLEKRLQACDTVFLYDLPVEECLAGVKARLGKPREDMPWVEEVFDEEFADWITQFPKGSLPLIKELLATYGREKDVYTFETRTEADAFLAGLPCKR